MNVVETFRCIEKYIGKSYSASFYEFLEEFLKLTASNEFKLLFRNSHFCTKSEVRNAIDQFIPEDVMPFLIDVQNGFEDYYCFDIENSENRNRVTVFSQDAVVFEWENYDDFLQWAARP